MSRATYNEDGGDDYSDLEFSHFELDAIGEIFSDCYLYNKGPSIPELRFVATVTIGGRVKFVPAV